MHKNVASLVNKAREQRRAANPEAAEESFRQAARISKSENDAAGQIAALSGLGNLQSDKNDHEGAVRIFKTAVASARTHGDVQLLAHVLRHLADAYRRNGDTDEAASHYAEALEIYHSDRSTEPMNLANTLRGTALMYEQAGKAAQAQVLWGQAEPIYRECGIAEGVSEARIAIKRCQTLSAT